MTLFRTPSILVRIATALERIADAMGQMLRDADGQFDEQRISRAVDDRLSKVGQREAKIREGYANMGVTSDEMIRQDLGLRKAAEHCVFHRVCSLLRSLFARFVQVHGGCR